MAEIRGQNEPEEIKPCLLPEVQAGGSSTMAEIQGQNQSQEIKQCLSPEVQPGGSTVSQRRPQQPAQASTNITEQMNYKNLLQEYSQRASIHFPLYQTINEGFQHAPKFRSTVYVDGSYYTSPEVFTLRKVAEQNVAKIAYEALPPRKVTLDGSLVNEDTKFCKSILIEYATKMALEVPSYTTTRPEGPIPIFVSTVVFNGVSYTGDSATNKREAEQLAARAAVLSILGGGDPNKSNVIADVINSKSKLFVAIRKAKDLPTTSSSSTPLIFNPGLLLGTALEKGNGDGVVSGAANVPPTAVSGPLPLPLPLANVTVGTKRPLHEFKTPKLESTSGHTDTPIAFVPPGLNLSSGKKRRNKKAKKTTPGNAQQQIPNQGPSCSNHGTPCSVAQ